jgi:hypothetical protein
MGMGASIHLNVQKDIVQEQEEGKGSKGERKGNRTSNSRDMGEKRRAELQSERTDRNRPVDPMKEYWTEAELSSHNNVDIEHIEIPEDYFIKHGRSVGRFEGRSHTSESVSSGHTANNEMFPATGETSKAELLVLGMAAAEEGRATRIN